ncbi:MAG: hypothetical protein M1821_003347 [Bathelium mastoideum]|nr:MAG: hypothetical protein M1821_003347 [Bathelium mastoideum]
MIDCFQRRQHSLSLQHFQPTDLPSPAPSEPSFFDIPYSISTPSPADFQRNFPTQYFGAPISYPDDFSDSAYSEPAQHMNPDFHSLNPAIRVQQSTPTPTPTPQFSSADLDEQSMRMGGVPHQQDWQMFEDNMKPFNMDAMQEMRTNGSFRGSRHRRRAHSSSSMASSGPASPYNPSTTFPYIANTDHSPQAAGPFDGFANSDEVATFPKPLPTPTQTPTNTTFLMPQQPDAYYGQGQSEPPSAHLAVKQVALDQAGVEDDTPAFSRSGRHSASSYDRESPITPRSSTNEYDDFHAASAGMRPPLGTGEWQKDAYILTDKSEFTDALPKLDRSISEVCQDELYNPIHATTAPPPPAKKMKPNSAPLSPMRRSLINERLQQADRVRSQSPALHAGGPIDNLSGQHIPGDYRSSGSLLASAAGSREQQKLQFDALAMKASRLSPSGDAPSKTISPKDAMLDYQSSEEEQMSLFPESNSNDYASDYSSGAWSSAPEQQAIPAQEYNTSMITSQPHPSSFTTSAPPQSNFSFTVPTTLSAQPTSGYVFSNSAYQPTPTSTSANLESAPEFPARLTSMESSMSDVDVSVMADAQRPSRTSGDSGTYSCTYHGCPRRFDNPQKLQKHKREGHRSVHHPLTALSGRSSSADEALPSGGSNMSSEALLARNSQAGPHKCERINPSTGKPCNTIFSRPYDLTRHEDTIHNARKQKVRCALCVEEKTFSRNDALTRHMRVVHPEVDFPGKHRRRGGQ